MPWIVSRRESKCAECYDDIELGQRIYFNGKAYCESDGCGPRYEKIDKEIADAKKKTDLRACKGKGQPLSY